MALRDCCLRILIILAFLASAVPIAAGEPFATTVTVRDLHCIHCAQKVATKLRRVPGVAAVKADVEAKTLTVEPKAQQAPSLRALWEAVEKAGKHPTRIEGPAGTFTARPES